MQHCSLQHQTLLLSPVISTAGYCFCFGSIPSFISPLISSNILGTYSPGDSSFSILSFCLFILFLHITKIIIRKGQIVIVIMQEVKALVTQLCSTLWDPMNSSLPVSSPWNFPGKNTGVCCHSLLQEISRPRDRTWVSCPIGRFFTI